ncbi:FAD-dependent oxidoreductase [Patescibacteria group bacterium]|nr:FAD-dependent oxidoreductase [Patescibacteria group bacterium]MBU4274789.1 FAD-dependent oxidoreductase [Patescibacteria group bacterium]MBU4367795.1 FAD-dependent oxidoreductase [Patescibacteria group bacterium]MBU4461485.1 FAD-dependent oxidoreductase [Patescibacteria group bacterium]MCG2700382.1 FAD-dependent oxidoreductase [Candidatus Parcubacteria bacterium]
MIYNLIIIGGGPAGITAGIYASRQRMKTLLITKELGGQIAEKAVDIENWPGNIKIAGPNLVNNFISHLKKQEVEIKYGEVRKIEKENNNFTIRTTENEKLFSSAVIIATGADPRPLEVPGEKEFIGKGVSYCVTCDGPLFKNKDIAIIGGGNAGFEAAIFMTNYASKIYILEYGSEIKADAENQEEAKKSKNIEVIKNAIIKEIKGDKMVNGLVYENSVTKKIKNLKVQGVFVEIGSQPATSLAKGLVDFNERDEIKVEFETFQTKTPGLFAVGDVNTGKYKQIITAAGEGCKAALAAYEYVKKQK